MFTHYFTYCVCPAGVLRSLKAEFVPFGGCMLIASLTAYNNMRASMNGKTEQNVQLFYKKGFFP